MATVKLSINTDEQTKKQAQALFEELGLDMTTAVNMFLKKAVREQGIPFDVAVNSPNAETRASLAEYEKMKAHPETYPRYSSFADVLKEVL